MRAVFGIDVSKVSSEVAILVNGEKVHGYTMPNDAIGFSRLLGDLKTVHKPEIIFEATGVYICWVANLSQVQLLLPPLQTRTL